MKEFELKESTIPAELSYSLMEHYSYNFLTERVPGIYRVLFFTVADILKHKKSKALPRVGFMLKDNNGNFKIGAILAYHAPETADDNDDKGNYTLEFTLDSKDMEDLDLLVDNHSDIFIECATRMASDIMYGKFQSFEIANNIFTDVVDVLVAFLDANATPSNEVSVVYKGIFTATVFVEGDEKVISIVPGEMIKQFIKGDTTL